MLRLRRPLGAGVSAGAAFRRAVLASAGVAVILSAICAMMVPRPIMKAAKIIIIRITPHSIRGTRNITTSAAKPRPIAASKPTIFAKRMSEALTEAFPHVPRGFTRRVGMALDGSSGQECLG